MPFFVAAEMAGAWNAYIVGFLVFSVSLYALARVERAEWTNVVLGVWRFRERRTGGGLVAASRLGAGMRTD